MLRQAADTGDPRHYPDADAALGRSLLLRPDGNAPRWTGSPRCGPCSAGTARRRTWPGARSRWIRRSRRMGDARGRRERARSVRRGRDAVGHMLDRRADVAALTRSAALDETSAGSTRPAPRWSGPSAPRRRPAETAQAHGALADLAFAGGDPLEAQRQIRLARTADPDDPDLLAGQATAEAAVGMIPAALADYASVVDSAAALVAARVPSLLLRAATATPEAVPRGHGRPRHRPTGSATGTSGTTDHAATAAAATPDAAAAAENPTAHATGGAGSPMAPDADVGGAAARAAAGLAVGGRRTVAPRYLAAAGELFEAVGRPGDARRAYASFTAMASLYATNGVPLAPEPALFAADRGDAAQALRLAEAGLRAGPTPAAQDAYAWALTANGRAAEAVTWSDKATSAGARNALFAFHRGMIESSLGRDGAAIDDLATALRTNPWFSPRLAPLARVTLTALSGLQ